MERDHPSDEFDAATIAVTEENATSHHDDTPQFVSDSVAVGHAESDKPVEDIVLRIAKAGTAPKARKEQDDDNLRGKPSQSAIRGELKWLQDPKALADRVARLLETNDLALASGLVRQAQREKRDCQVAWNHILQYSMDQNQPLAAFKFYNDMKKRGRKPSSHTYTIMLRGLSRVEKTRDLNPVKTALSIYKSISAANSAVKLNVIHSNAMLVVCSRHGDMNTMWQIASDMPEHGPCSPDSQTYTIILGAIRTTCQKHVDRMDTDDFDRIQERRAKAVIDGKKLWPDIIYRWTSGSLDLDNTIVQMMATLLLESGTDQDCYDAFQLFHQVSGVPVLARRPSPAIPQPGKRRKSGTIEHMVDVPFVDEYGVPLGDQPRDHRRSDETGEEDLSHVFDPPREDARGRGPSYLKIDNRGLSTILDACLTINQGTGVGKAYWQHLTKEDHQYKVEPDAAACHQYLRLLRLSRSSNDALELIRDQMIPGRLVKGKTFHIAFSVVQRDRRNINILKTANKILELMDGSLALPDTRALEGYLDLMNILCDNPQLLLALNGLDMETQARSSNLPSVGQKLQLRLKMVAVTSLRVHAYKLHEAMENGIVTRTHKGRRIAEIIENHSISGFQSLKVLVRVRRLIDDILNSAKVPGASKEELKLLRRDSSILKKYSDAETFQKYKNALFIPTENQLTGFRERIRTTE